MSLPTPLESSAPTWVRYRVVAVCTLMAVLLYLDRLCFALAEVFIKDDLGLTDTQIGIIMGAFFWTYAIFQVPSGWLSDRYGSRVMLASYILLWSLFTGLNAVATGFVMLLLFRFGMGVGQAGAYPTSAKIISQWMPLAARGMASSIVSFGGRVGGFLAPLLTGYLIYLFVPISDPSEFESDDLLNVPNMAATAMDEAQSDSPFIQTLKNGLSSRSRQLFEELAQSMQEREALIELKEAEPDTKVRDLPTIDGEQRSQLVADLNSLVGGASLYDDQSFQEIALNEQADSLLERPFDELNVDEQTRLNRLLIEARFPDDVRKVHGRGWRPPMAIYGLAGIAMALLFWIVIRDEPRQHPRCNDQEIAFIERGLPSRTGQVRKPVGRAPMRELITNVPMWMACVVQFTTVVGWIFLVTWLPRYLQEQHHIPLAQRAVMLSVPMFVGWFGMLSGGWLTDQLAVSLGVRWGRILPISLSRFLAMAAYVVCLFEPSPWVAVACFSVVAFATDLGNPAIWAFSQDVGGRHVGSVLGWGNMWGNFGAAIGPPLLIAMCEVKSTTGVTHDWNIAFMICGAAFLISGLAALGMDPLTPIVQEDESL